MIIYGKTDIGMVRQNNEDAYFYKEKDSKNFIAFVCDGMGGHVGGSYASQKTIEILAEAYKNANIKSVGIWLYETLQKANETVYLQAQSNENLSKMGTTVTGVICINGTYYYAHVGDSRVYVYDESNISQITTDHTLVNSLLHSGYITYKQALKHPKKHVLTNALGIKKELSVDIGELPLKENQNILICSDGLYNSLEPKKILKVLSSKESIVSRADELVSKANSAGGSDNLTFILIENNR